MEQPSLLFVLGFLIVWHSFFSIYIVDIISIFGFFPHKYCRKSDTFVAYMEAGAYMGLYFVVKFIFAVLSLNYPFCNVVSTIMLLFVPLVVFFMMRRFSNQNEGGSYFSQLWMMGILLFFFASLISGLAQYIYYVYINPEYIKSQLSAAVTLLESLNMTSDPSLLEAVKTGLEQGNIPSPMAVVIQQMWVNVFFGSLLSAVMAWLVSVWFKSSKTKK